MKAGSTVIVRTIDSIDSSKNRAGDEFLAALAEPIMVGQIVVTRSANAHLRLVEARQSGRFTRKSELVVQLVSLDWQGKSFPIVSSAFSVQGTSEGDNLVTIIDKLARGKQARIAPETRIDFRLQQPVSITYVPSNAQER